MLRCNSSPSQLEYISDDSWTAPSIGRQYGPPFSASTSTALSIYRRPSLANFGPRQFFSSFLLLSDSSRETLWMHTDAECGAGDFLESTKNRIVVHMNADPLLLGRQHTSHFQQTAMLHGAIGQGLILF
jgi:hypothetical protein